jgi:hypothetical protein
MPCARHKRRSTSCSVVHRQDGAHGIYEPNIYIFIELSSLELCLLFITKRLVFQISDNEDMLHGNGSLTVTTRGALFTLEHERVAQFSRSLQELARGGKACSRSLVNRFRKACIHDTVPQKTA